MPRLPGDRRRYKRGTEIGVNQVYPGKTVGIPAKFFKKLKNPKPEIIYESTKTRKETAWPGLVTVQDRRKGTGDRRVGDRRITNLGSPGKTERRKPGRDRRQNK